jgi:predicted permease
MFSVFEDILYAGRTLRKDPAFAAVAIASLSLGIGANSAIFSFTDALMFRPMEVPRSSEIVSVSSRTKSERMAGMSYPDYVDLRDSTRTVSGLIAYQTSMVGLSTAPDQVPELAVGMLISSNFLPVLEIQPALGRNFRPEEDSGTPGGHAVAILSDVGWERRFNRDPAVLGKTVRVNGTLFTIVGVTPKSFPGVDHYMRPEVYIPIRMFRAALAGSPPARLEARGDRWLSVAGRLNPGLSPKTANAECAAIMGRLASAWPAANANRSVIVLQERDARFARSPGDGMLARSLLAIVGLVLLIACANAANLLLARASGRAREIAVRLAVGAGRSRLIRQLLTENLLLAAISGVVGLVLAYWGIQGLALLPISTDLPIVFTPRLDARAVWYTALVSLATGILFGLAPAWRSSRSDLVPALKGVEGFSSKGARRFTLRNVLVVAQVAFSVTALIGGGLMVRAFIRVGNTDMGFRTEGVLLSSLNPSMASYTDERGSEFYRQLVEKVQAAPGVERAALASHIPFGIAGARATPVVVDGYEMPADQDNIQILSSSISPGFFSLMRIRLVRGRDFDSRDSADSQRVVIVNETMARKYWRGNDPLGSRIRIGNRSGAEAVVVGIAGDSKYQWALETPMPYLYRPFSQAYVPRLTLLAATGSKGLDPSALADPVRAAVRSLDANVPVFDVRTFRSFYTDRALAPGRIITTLVGVLGGLGMALAMAGLYGVISFTISRRTREIGIRIAVGADALGVTAMVLRQGLTLGGIGVVIGVLLALAVTPGMSAFLGEGAGTDPLVFVAIPVILLAGTGLASWAPARRAARIDPWIALRYE